MKCPKCQKLGLKSRVYDQGATRTLLGNMGYYDEEGNYHFHDTNIIKSGFKCSEGHMFMTIQKGSPCPSYPKNCDYGGGEIEIKTLS